MITRWSPDIDDATLYALREDAHVHRRETLKWLESCHTFLMFLGIQRSGHSLLGSLLDAHRNLAIANELNALRFFDSGFNHFDICRLIQRNTEESARAGREQSGYSYEVEGQWQGRTERCLVIGDKKGGVSARLLATSSKTAVRLQTTLRLPLKILVVTRNPFDNIVTISRRKEIELAQAVNFYSKACRFVRNARRELEDAATRIIRFEELVRSKDAVLSGICEFLGVEPHEDWIEACGKVVWEEPRLRRNDIDWPPELRKQVEKIIEENSMLMGYRFDDETDS